MFKLAVKIVFGLAILIVLIAVIGSLVGLRS